MTLLSDIYDVTLKRGIRGAAKGGFVRPTVGEHFMTHMDFENISSYHNPVFLTKITAPDGAADDRFGVSVAVSDTKIVVGANLDNTAGGTDAGSAYIFNTNGTYVTKIIAPDGYTTDWFGISVAISDTKVVVGAPLNDDNGSASGSAYIFNTDGSYVTKITAPDGTASDYFGHSVAISNTKIIVGAYGSISAYIFDTDGTYVTKISAPYVAEHFGYSVAISDTKIVVGDNFNSDKGNDSGSAYIFNIDGTYVTKITAPDGAANAYFGSSVAISDTKIVVGAYLDDNAGGTDAGAAYIFNTDGTYVTKITAPDGAASDNFGYSVAVYDPKVVVGAYGENEKGTRSGSAYIFNTSGAFVTKITAPDGAIDDRFGVSVAVSDTKAVVGAHLDDDKGAASGSAYIYDI